MNKKDLMSKTKKVLVEMLKGITPKTQEDEDIITYTLDGLKKNSRNVTKVELVDILLDIFKTSPLPIEGKAKKTISKEQATQEILDILEDKQSETKKDKKPVENKPKKIKKTNKKSTKKEEVVPVEVEEDETVEEVVTTPKKSKGNTKVKPVTKEVVVSFPDQFKSTLGTLKMRKDIKDIKQFANEIEEGKQLVIGTYWTKQLLKQFKYDLLGLDVHPKSFQNDLDLLDIYYASNNVVYGISVYTECHYALLPEHFTQCEDTGIRYTFGIEFEVYEIVE